MFSKLRREEDAGLSGLLTRSRPAARLQRGSYRVET